MVADSPIRGDPAVHPSICGFHNDAVADSYILGFRDGDVADPPIRGGAISPTPTFTEPALDLWHGEHSNVTTLFADGFCLL